VNSKLQTKPITVNVVTKIVIMYCFQNFGCNISL